MREYLFILTTPDGVKSQVFNCKSTKEAKALAVGIKTGAVLCGQKFVVVQVFNENNREIFKTGG